jgi:tRNA(adenine34) deaminase
MDDVLGTGVDVDGLMVIALAEAAAAAAVGEVPVGAVVARRDTGEVLARRHNERETGNDPTAHAEVLALRDAAGALGTWRLSDCVLVVTLEPCAMCAGAALSARVPIVVFAAADLKAGALGSLYHLGSDPRLNHSIVVRDGVRASDAAELLEQFFAERRRVH